MRLRWRAVGRPPPVLHFGMRSALVVKLQRTPNEMLHMLAVMLLQKQKSLILQFSGTFTSTMRWCSARVILVLLLP